MKKDKLVIIDGNAIVHRAYHAIPPLTNKKGEMVNAVYGFASMMLKVWKEGNAVYTKPQIVPLDAVDFVGFILQVLIES